MNPCIYYGRLLNFSYTFTWYDKPRTRPAYSYSRLLGSKQSICVVKSQCQNIRQITKIIHIKHRHEWLLVLYYQSYSSISSKRTTTLKPSTQISVDLINYFTFLKINIVTNPMKQLCQGRQDVAEQRNVIGGRFNSSCN